MNIIVYIFIQIKVIDTDMKTVTMRVDDGFFKTIKLAMKVVGIA